MTVGVVVAALVVAATACGESRRETVTTTHSGSVTTASMAAPSTQPTVVATEVTADGELVATRPDGTRQHLGQIPSVILKSRQIAGGWPPGTTPYVGAFVSAKGWVAVTGMVSEGFWFFRLGDPSRPPRFVDLDGLPGGHTSAGIWNPAGTLFAAVENGRTAAVIDPTGETWRLKSADAPIGYPPTWTADGSGLLTGREPPPCVSADPTVSRSLGIVPIDGRPVTTAIPALADGRSLVAAGGIWAHEDRCPSASTPDLTPFSNIAVVAPGGPRSWVDGTDVAGAALYHSVFASTRPTLWVLAVERASSEVRLYDAHGPHTVRLANTVQVTQKGVWADESFAQILSVAADDSAVVVLVDGRGLRRRFVLVPTDGGPATTLNGEFAGFVPRSLLDALAAP
jgi:hypothetical protein